MVDVYAVILAGGQSRRLGGVAKAGLEIGGVTLLQRTLDAALTLVAPSSFLAGAIDSTIDLAPEQNSERFCSGAFVVGPQELIAGWLRDEARPSVMIVQEAPPFAGPAAGLAAALDEVPEAASHILLLSCDMPQVQEVVAELVAAFDGDEAGVIAIDGGKAQYLAGIYPAGPLRLAVAEARGAHRLNNASVRSLLVRLKLNECLVSPGSTADVDTWEDAARFGIN